MNEAINDPKHSWPELMKQALTRIPARLFVGRAGVAYPTSLSLKLRADHAVARDAVYQEIDAELDPKLIERYGYVQAKSQATSRTEYLLRPDLGRLLDHRSQELIVRECPQQADLQIVLGDGLSPSAAIKQGLKLLALLFVQAEKQQWLIGKPIFVRFCRVGILNEIGRLLHPVVVVLLIGERPGLAQAESLSAYLAYQPQPGHTDAQRNLISNIHSQGVQLNEAADRIMNLAASLRLNRTSGVPIKEKLATSWSPEQLTV